MKQNKILRILKWIACLVLAAAVLAVIYYVVPKVTGAYMITVVNGALVYFVANLGCALMLGQCGLVSFAAVAFMGVGGFTSTLLSMQYGLNPFLAMFCAMLVSMLVAWLLGMPLMRLNGTFFTFSTIALTQIGYTVFNGWKQFTGGPNGIARVPAFQIFGWTAKTYYDNYYVLATICIIAALIAMRLKKINFGRSMSSVRDNSMAAKCLGVNVYQTKIASFVIAAGFAGFAGAALAHSSHYVVSTYFTFDTATTNIIQIMVGGVYNIFGVFLGTILITMLPEWLRPLQEYIRLVYGVGVILLMIFMPMGLMGTIQNFWKWAKRKLKVPENLTTIGTAAPNAEVIPGKEEP